MPRLERLVRLQLLLFSWLLGILSVCSVQAEPQPEIVQPAITVGVFDDAPFAVRNASGQWTGFAVELLLEVAARSGFTISFKEYPSLEALYSAVSRGEVEMGAGNTLVTSRDLENVDFSQPMLDGGLRLMVDKREQHSFARLWEGLKRNGHAWAVVWVPSAVFAASIALLVALRIFDPQFTRHWRDGFAESFYHVVSVCVTGKTKYSGALAGGWGGRIVAALWLCFGLGIVAYITSMLTSVMTANTLNAAITSPKDLTRKVAAVLEGSAGDRYCAVHDVQVVRVATLDEAVKALLAHRVDAIVSDAASLESFDLAHPDLPITETGELFERRHFAYPIKPNSPGLLKQVNVGLLRVRESGILDHVRGEWFTR